MRDSKFMRNFCDVNEAASRGPREYGRVVRGLMKDTGGQLSIGSAITIAGVVVSAVVGLAVLAALAPTWFNSTGDLAENFSTANVSDSTANSIANDIFPLIIALLGVFAIAGLAFSVMKLGKRGQ